VRNAKLKLVIAAALTLSLSAAERSRHIELSDLPAAIRTRLAHVGLDERTFNAYIRDVETATNRRVANGEREHLVYYALQSNRFTDRPRIEPAISAERFVRGLSAPDRQRLIADPSYLPDEGWLPAERARVADLLRALGKDAADVRITYFRQLLPAAGLPATPESLYPDYVRAMRFLYRKEFPAAGRAPDDIARLYQERSHSSDTQVEAGYAVYVGLGTLGQLEPDARIRRVLVVGPGLDLAPRTDLIDAAPPQSYQPFAIADALLALSLASASDLRVHSIDVNPRVVRFIDEISQEPTTLHLFAGIKPLAGQPLRPDYHAYMERLGRAIGDTVAAPHAIAADSRYQHSIRVKAAVAAAMSAERLNIVTERIVGEPFDLIVATNVLTYFDDRELALALSNIGAMMRPGGWFLHNESRPGLVEIAGTLDMPVGQMRTVILGGPADKPFYDVAWLHRRKR
jgi:hypothetical protein